MTAPVWIDQVALGARLRAVRETAEVSQEEASAAIDVSPPTYAHIEAGTRPLKGDELIALADCLGVRVGAITGALTRGDGLPRAARIERTSPPTAAMAEKLRFYLELDAYLADQAIDQV